MCGTHGWREGHLQAAAAAAPKAHQEPGTVPVPTGKNGNPDKSQGSQRFAESSAHRQGFPIPVSIHATDIYQVSTHFQVRRRHQRHSSEWNGDSASMDTPFLPVMVNRLRCCLSRSCLKPGSLTNMQRPKVTQAVLERMSSHSKDLYKQTTTIRV